jgi:hypothetical protein
MPRRSVPFEGGSPSKNRPIAAVSGPGALLVPGAIFRGIQNRHHLHITAVIGPRWKFFHD